MNGTDIQHLIDQSTSTDISSLLMAKEAAKQRMISDPSSVNVSGYDRAAAMLDRALEKQRMAAGSPEAPQAVESLKFRRLSEVVKWLKDEGYKIKKSKIYLDAKSGYLVASEDGGYSREAVLAYIHTQSLDKSSDSKTGKLDALSEKRLEKEVEKLTVQVEKLTWDMERDQGKYLPKEEVRMELALKISVFEAGFKHMAATQASDWVAAVGGKQEKNQVLIERIHTAIDALLGEFSQVDELDIVVGS